MAGSKTKKGKLQAYDQWTPEYTAKGKLTARSQKRLDAIRSNAMAEQVLGSDMNDFVDIAAFVGLTTAFYYGINPFLYQVLGALAGIAEAGNKLWEVSIGTLADGGSAVIRVLGGGELEAQRTADQLAAEAMKNKETQLANKKQVLETWRATMVNLFEKQAEAPTVPAEATQAYWEGIAHGIEVLEKAIADVMGAIARLEIEIASKKLTSSDLAWAQRKADAINLGISFGEAGFTMWFAKSYTFSDAVENITLTG